MYLLSYEAVLAEETQSGQPDDDLREKQRQLEILNSQIEEKTALLRGREAEMNRLERQLSIKLTDLLVEVERKEMLLREMEGKVRRLERKSRWHVALAR